ncbi:MAG TPA: tRNA threonylcarbamoyladenosine dehydratase [Desulfuromonadales bacterium]|nr:tRNA threonylcarbamoyladenosine dehydratase [Desulfuromonadales bacterium]
MSRFERLERLIGAQGLTRLAGSSIAVFGLGGVGSYAVEGLVRGGIGQLFLVDHDRVEASNLNRQIQALEETLGEPKAEALAARCRAINPDARIRCSQLSYGFETAEELLDRRFDYVLDCIDQVTAKLHLLEICRQRNLPVISSMGAAGKLDPAGLQVADIAETHTCGLARIMRKELRTRGIARGVKVVFSTAPVLSGQPPGTRKRSDPLGSSSVVPPLFGMTMAAEVLKALLAKGNG